MCVLYLSSYCHQVSISASFLIIVFFYIYFLLLLSEILKLSLKIIVIVMYIYIYSLCIYIYILFLLSRTHFMYLFFMPSLIYCFFLSLSLSLSLSLMYDCCLHQILCPCNGVWEYNIPRTIANCDNTNNKSMCELSVRGLPLGSSLPVYGSLLRQGNMAFTTVMNQDQSMGYSMGFSSRDYGLTVNTAGSAGMW